jgi:hypothetical protein
MNNYKYLLHGHFENNITKLIDKTRDYISKKYKNEKSDLPFNYGLPHITIIYGPVIKSDNMITLSDNIIDSFYPGFLENFKELPSDIKYIGISAFFAPDRIVIKAEFESKQLNKMRMYLINTNPKIKSYYDDFKLNYKKNEKELKLKYPNIFVKDKSYNKTPKGWIHSTLIVLKPDISDNQFNKIIKDVDNKFKLKKGMIISLKEIGIHLKNNFYKINSII